MNYEELLEKLAPARPDMPVKVRMKGGKFAEIGDVEFEDEVWNENSGPQGEEQTHHRVTGIVIVLK